MFRGLLFPQQDLRCLIGRGGTIAVKGFPLPVYPRGHREVYDLERALVGSVEHYAIWVQILEHRIVVVAISHSGEQLLDDHRRIYLTERILAVDHVEEPWALGYVRDKEEVLGVLV